MITDHRRCLICGERVTNKNLGGHNGRSALTGGLFCEAHADGPNRPSSAYHPLPQEFVTVAEDARAVITAVLETAMAVDGSPASAARAIEMKILASIMKRRLDRIADEQLSKAIRS